MAAVLWGCVQEEGFEEEAMSCGCLYCMRGCSGLREAFACFVGEAAAADVFWGVQDGEE